MTYEYLSQALSIEDKTLKKSVDQAQRKLEAVPDTYYGLFWLYTHDYLYVSKSIENVLGHSLEKFKHHGVVFLQTIIPTRYMSTIYDSLDSQASEIENDLKYLFSKKL